MIRSLHRLIKIKPWEYQFLHIPYSFIYFQSLYQKDIKCEKAQYHLPQSTLKICSRSCTDPEWRTGGPDPHPLENHKNIRFFSNKKSQSSDQASIQCWAIISMLVKRHLNEWSANSGIWILSPLINLKSNKKNVV